MLQRIQTVHLLIVTALLATLLFTDFATASLGAAGVTQTEEVATAVDGSVTRTTVARESVIIFDTWGIYQDDQEVMPTTYMSVLVIIALATAFFNIFLYRKRWIQIRLCFALAIMLLGIAGFIVMYSLKLHDVLLTLDYPAIRYHFFADALPVIALIFVYLAFRGIARDEALVRSLDRIR